MEIHRNPAQPIRPGLLTAISVPVGRALRHTAVADRRQRHVSLPVGSVLAGHTAPQRHHRYRSAAVCSAAKEVTAGWRRRCWRIRRRSLSEAPPQTPSSMRWARAYSRHWARTGQTAHRQMATLTPPPSWGNIVSGGTSRQRPRAIHVVSFRSALTLAPPHPRREGLPLFGDGPVRMRPRGGRPGGERSHATPSTQSVVRSPRRTPTRPSAATAPPALTPRFERHARMSPRAF